MANYVPVFDYGKDSYILKHKINYNTTSENGWSGVTFGVLFTDYDLARKTQSSNAENFDPIVITEDINDVLALQATYYNEQWIVELTGHTKLGYYVVSGGTNLYDIYSSGKTIVSSNRYQAYYIPSVDTSLFQVGDYVNVYFDGVSGATGSTTWEHYGESGETWMVTGTTTNGIPWIVTGSTTASGITSGTTTWSVTDITPVLKYRAKVLEVGTEYLKLERKLEDYLYNNLMKIASSTNYNYLFYSIESLDFSDKSYYGIKYVYEESVWAGYFSLSATTDQLIIQPTPNKANLYFDYDNVEITVYMTGGTSIVKKFVTNNLYTKYKLDTFVNQLGYPSSIPVYYDHSAVTSATYNGEMEFDILLTNSGDTQYFTPYTYIYATGFTQHIFLITKITGLTITVMSARVNMTIGEPIIAINNMITVEDISKMLYECYINIENDTTLVYPFYDGDFFDPNQIGMNVIDSNVIGDWVFFPTSGVTY